MVIAKSKCECGGDLKSRGVTWQCVKCGNRYARSWKSDYYGVYIHDWRKG